MADATFQRFGKYLILDHLVDGGMAKICRARYLGEQANKIVAIKMVQPQYSKDPSFVQMFEDELKVTFDLLHPNIAQVYDYGMVDEQLFSAMEYIDGANLKQFLDRLKQKKYVFPVEISTYIISQVSQALHYAHNFTDKLKGTNFNIIHRDISPHNIMLTYDGAVKVIDFGIAKADSNSEATQAGTIKGKLSYLAPEYLEGLDLDHRYDQFAVGISLWEMLCSRKLFTAKNDLAVLKQIQACKIPKPSSINPNVPAELDAIVMKALSKDRSKRFENMDKLNRALVKFLYSNYPEFNATDLGYFAKQLFVEEITADRKKFVEFGKIDIGPYLDEIKNLETSGVLAGPAETKHAKASKIVLDLGDFSSTDSDGEETLSIDLSSKQLEQSDKKSKAVTPKTIPSKTKPRINKVSGKTRLTRVQSKNKKAVPQKKSSSSLLPKIIAASFAFALLTQNDFIAEKTGIEAFCSLGLSECTIANKTVGKNDPARESDRTSGQSKKSSQYEMGSISFQNFDHDMKVYINDKLVDISGISHKIQLGKEFTVSIAKSGYKRWDLPKKMKLTSEKPYQMVNIPELQELKMGYLSSSQNFTSGSVLIFSLNGKKVEKELPIKNERLPAGTYEAVIANKLLQTERNIRFTVKENKKEVIE